MVGTMLDDIWCVAYIDVLYRCCAQVTNESLIATYCCPLEICPFKIEVNTSPGSELWENWVDNSLIH